MPLMAVSTAPPHSFWPQSKPLSPSSSLSLPLRSRPELTLLRRYRLCRAAKQQQAGPSKKRPGKRKPSEKPASHEAAAVEVVAPPARQSQPSSIPKPPAGFVLDPHGKVLLASSKRIATIVDAANNLPLECVIRRVFQSSRGDECMLLCPVDTPVQILKSTNFNGWSAVNDDEIEAIIPSAAYALAKIHMHLVVSGFCYTARGGFCYSEEDILEFGTDDGEDIDGLPTEGIEITCFHMDGAHYMIYAPSDPLLFVAVKDKNGLQPGRRQSLAGAPPFRSAFDVLDADRDGKISSEDLRSFYSGLPSCPREEDISSMISAADADRDGFVQFGEFELVLGRSPGGGGVMEEVFRVMDRDGDGVVGFEDLKAYLGWAGLPDGDEDIRAMIRMGGGEDSGGVELDAFLKILAVDFATVF